MAEITLNGTSYLHLGSSGAGEEIVGAEATPEQVAAAAAAAGAAAGSFGLASPDVRAQFLDLIATNLEALGDAWIEQAHRETHLPTGRLVGERGRTCGQLRQFAKALREGITAESIIDAADPNRAGTPKPRLVRKQVPIGPVAVFGASNFPFAFSVAGGDTASALAAGCPVVVKGHPGHRGTSDMAARAILKAVEELGLPEGTFSMVHGGAEVGRELVLRPEIEAVAFTGSQRAGRALFDLGSGRDRPIPVFAEMGSVNPVFVFPGALQSRLDPIAKGYADSLTLGVGQFCTNPGVLVGLASPEFERLLAHVATHLMLVEPAPMLHEGIRSGYAEGVAKRASAKHLETVIASRGTDEGGASPALFATSAKEFFAQGELREELFGPAGIAVRCENFAQMQEVAWALRGQLTATVQYDESDVSSLKELLPTLVRIAGRLVANGFPTGVEVSPAMQHGGPYPATTDGRFTSVGLAAIERFLRPVAFQNFADDLI